MQGMLIRPYANTFFKRGFYHRSMLTQHLDTVLPDVLIQILRSGHSKMQVWQEKLI